MQAAHDSEHGKKYTSFYPNVTFPYIAIIDSRTGEHMATFDKTDHKEFCLFLKEFIKGHGMLNADFSSCGSSGGNGKLRILFLRQILLCNMFFLHPHGMKEKSTHYQANR